MKSICLKATVYGFVCFCFLFSACNKKEVDRVKHIMPKDSLKSVLLDLYLVDGILANVAYSQMIENDSLSVYYPVYKKHGTSRDEIDTCLKILSRYPVEYEKLYQEIIDELSMMEGEVLDSLKKEKPGTKDQ